MKVLIITKTINPTSGWGRLSIEPIKRISKIYETVVLSEDDVENEDLGFKYVKILQNNNLLNFLRNCLTSYKIGKNIDVIHALDLWPYGVYAFFASRFGKKKYLISGIGTYSVAPLKKKFGWLLKLVYRRAFSVPCISQYTKDRIDELAPGAKTQITHLGLSDFSDVKANESFLNEHGITKKDYPVIVTVGEIKGRKGQTYTAMAVKKIKNKYPNIKYLIVGGSSYENYIKQIKEIDKSVGGNTMLVIDDADTDAELRALYERADIFALNSVNDEFYHFEGFGIVILEANQFGVPAIGSRDCGIEEVIMDGVNGYLCEQRNPDDIAEKIEKILAKGKEFWKKNSIAHTKNFLWDGIVERYFKYYR